LMYRESVRSLHHVDLLHSFRRGTRSRTHGGTITSRGFQFLLEDVHKQLWDVILEYLKTAEVRTFLLFSAEYGVGCCTGARTGSGRSFGVHFYAQ
jgi:hypothetical protein